MHKLIAAAAVTAVACLLPASAFAATPAKSSSFAWCVKKNSCPLSFETNKKGTQLVNFKLYSKCSPLPAMEGWPNFKVKKGKFSRKGTFENVLGETISFRVVGSFTSRKKAVGTFDVDAKGCSDKKRKFVAKRRGRAGAQA